MNHLNMQPKHRQQRITYLIFTLLACSCIGFFHMFHTPTHADSHASREPSLTRTGQSNAHPVKIPVLMYHHFIDQEQFMQNQFNLTGSTVLKKNFIQQMTYLHDQGYTTITVSQLLGYIKNKDALPPKPILITSDDGYLSNYLIMYPILQSMGMKATIFLIGERVDQADQLSPKESPKLNWKQIQEMYASQVIDFQSHTYNSHSQINVNGHALSNFATPESNETHADYIARIDADLKRSIQGFKLHLGYTPIAFAYPYGQYNKSTESIIKSNGIKMSFSTKSGFVDSTSSAFLIKRIGVNGMDDLATFSQKLNNAVRSISLNRKSISLAPTESSQLTVKAISTDPASNPILWSSSHSNIAVVDRRGNVTAVAIGTATITAASANDTKKKATVTVTVKVPVTHVTMNTSIESLNINQTSQLIATVYPITATNKSVTWSSSNKAIATVDPSGTITGKAKGMATITLKSVDDPTKIAIMILIVK